MSDTGKHGISGGCANPLETARQTTAEAQHGRGEALDDSDTEELLRLLRANPELAQLLRGLATERLGEFGGEAWPRRSV